MATVHITFRNPTQVGGASLPSASPRAAQTITSSGTSQASTITAQKNEIATITVSGGDVFIAVGAAPVAASGAGDLVVAGSTIGLGFVPEGHKVAVIDA